MQMMPLEAARLKSLHAIAILDTVPDERFDSITRLACRTMRVPTAMISFIDENRQWAKSASGMFASGQETSRVDAFCARA
ncbi:MAG: diguanylate cyclase, partial [Rhizorhabdus sp.]|nr:diguanylate cyclase [Rhizorhabdus sp.]